MTAPQLSAYENLPYRDIDALIATRLMGWRSEAMSESLLIFRFRTLNENRIKRVNLTKLELVVAERFT